MRTPPHSIAALIPAALVFTAALSTASAQDSAESEADTPVVNDTPIEAGLEQQTLLPDPFQDADDERWIDAGHDYATTKANEMTQWVDNFFGNDERDLEQADSRLRLRTIYNWDGRLDNEVKFRLGGKVSLPQISKRLDLVFRGEDMDDFSNEGVDDPSEDRIGLQYQVGPTEAQHHRFDLTVGFGSSGPKPGVKYVYQDAFAEDLNFRFTQRFTYDLGEGGYGTSRFVLDKALRERELVRAYTKLLYGEETDGTEWSSSLSYARGWEGDGGRVGASWLYIGADGQTEPYDFVKNYKVGLRLRRQALRDFLFWEIEPSYNWRVDEPYFDREGAWRVELRLEFLMFDGPLESVEKQIR
ncbi:MAG: hypothetical protein P8M73_08500 [Luminiphilus sp.]|nr:hypothetical protein [Luminiphilus sp.]